MNLFKKKKIDKIAPIINKSINSNNINIVKPSTTPIATLDANGNLTIAGGSSMAANTINGNYLTINSNGANYNLNAYASTGMMYFTGIAANISGYYGSGMSWGNYNSPDYSQYLKDKRPDYEKMFDVYIKNNKDKEIKEIFKDACKIAYSTAKLQIEMDKAESNQNAAIP